MENDPNQQPQNQPPAVELSGAGPVVPPVAPVPVVTPPQPVIQPTPPSPQPISTVPPAPQKHIGNYIIVGFGVLILLSMVLPKSRVAQMLFIPIILLGAVAGITFFVKSIRSSKGSNPLVRVFVIFGGLGVGVVIFIISLIQGLVVFAVKDPNQIRSA